jgi:hypothetical protein
MRSRAVLALRQEPRRRTRTQRARLRLALDQCAVMPVGLPDVNPFSLTCQGSANCEHLALAGAAPFLRVPSATCAACPRSGRPERRPSPALHDRAGGDPRPGAGDDLGGRGRSRGGGAVPVHPARFLDRPVRRRCHRARFHLCGAAARPVAGGDRRGDHVCRRNRAGGFRARARRTRPDGAHRPIAPLRAPQGGPVAGDRAREGRPAGRRVARAGGRSAAGGRCPPRPGGAHRRVGRHGRASAGKPPRGRSPVERDSQRRRSLRDARVRPRGPEHLCRHRAHGRGGADRQGAIHPHGRPLCPLPSASHAPRRRHRLVHLARSDSARSQYSWSPPLAH